MKRSGFPACILTIGLVLPAVAAEFKFPAQTFTVPEGFSVERIAGPPLVDRPIVADFDEQGRLYVADSSGSNDKVEKQLQDKPHRIVRLEDSDGDGAFDKTLVFADKMMFPEGTMWFDGSLYVSAPPSIWKLTDTNGDGVADERVEWFQGKTLTGCANDLHGPYLGPDGWIYWAKGAFAKQTHERPGRAPFVTRAAHIFRCRPDGSGLEPVMTGGMDNPVDVVFTPSGERIFTTTFFQHPGGGQRDGLIHAIYGGVYGKQHDVLEDHKKTGELMPVLTHLGPAAPCGLARYESRAFGPAYENNLFACNFNLHKITRHVLEPHGATFRATDSDFLVSDNTDFHPTDVLEDADGSLLVIDTGGWYKLCCPTSQLWKPDVLGAIYRVRRTGAPRINDPRGLKLAWANMPVADLIKLLGDERPAVRNRAIQQIGQQPGGPAAALMEGFAQSSQAPHARTGKLAFSESQSRRSAVWALTRIRGQVAREAVRMRLGDHDETVCQAAIHSVSVWRDAEALPRLIGLLTNQSPHLKRAAAEAIGRIGDKSAAPELLKAAAGVRNDRALEHSLIYALIEIADPESARNGLLATSPQTKRAALIALDQMDYGGLKPETVTPFLVSPNELLKETASWIVGRRPDWADALAGFFRERLLAKRLTESDRIDLERQLAQLARGPAIQELLAQTLADAATPNESRLTALRAMAKAGLKETPSAWSSELARILQSKNGDVIRQAVVTTRALPAPKSGIAELTTALLRVARAPATRAEVRLGALAAVPGGLTGVESELFDFLCANVQATNPVLTRTTAASILAKAKLDPAQLLALAEVVKTAGPLEMPQLVAAFEKATNEALGLKLIGALQNSAGLSGLRAETLKPRLTNFPAIVQQQADHMLASLNVDLAKQQAHLEALLAGVKGGDIRRGQAIFNSAKTACSSCHAIGYLGGNLGPDLTRIGQIRTERDLLESIVYPSASFVRSYEPVMVLTKSGDQHSGVLRQDSPEEVLLGTGPGTEVRIARSDVSEMRPGSVSVMPGGLEEQLSRSELADLLAFLKAAQR